MTRQADPAVIARLTRRRLVIEIRPAFTPKPGAIRVEIPDEIALPLLKMLLVNVAMRWSKEHQDVIKALLPGIKLIEEETNGCEQGKRAGRARRAGQAHPQPRRPPGAVD